MRWRIVVESLLHPHPLLHALQAHALQRCMLACFLLLSLRVPGTGSALNASNVQITTLPHCSSV
jgi:hypothetical protein